MRIVALANFKRVLKFVYNSSSCWGTIQSGTIIDGNCSAGNTVAGIPSDEERTTAEEVKKNGEKNVAIKIKANRFRSTYRE